MDTRTIPDNTWWAVIKPNNNTYLEIYYRYKNKDKFMDGPLEDYWCRNNLCLSGYKAILLSRKIVLIYLSRNTYFFRNRKKMLKELILDLSKEK